MNQIGPSEWKFVPITKVCDLITGGTPSKGVPRYWEDGSINWLVSGDVNKQFIYEVNGKITKDGMDNSNAKMIPSDSVIIALNGQGKTRGTVAVLKVESTCNQSIVAFIPKDKKELDYLFLFYYLKSQYRYLRNLTGDNERSGLSMRILKKMHVPLPQYDEQIRISSKINEKITRTTEIKREVEVEKEVTNVLFQSILDKYFSFRIGSSLPEGWKWGNLKDATDNWENDIVSGPFGSNLVVSDYQTSGVPLIRLQNVQRSSFIDNDIKFIRREKAEELKRHSFRSGDLILAKLGIPIGKTCTVPNYLESGIIVADVVRIRISKWNSAKFFEFLLNSTLVTNQLTSKIIGSTRPRVNLSHVRELKLPIPVLEEQLRIVEKLTEAKEHCNLVMEDIDRMLTAASTLSVSLLEEVFGNYKKMV